MAYNSKYTGLEVEEALDAALDIREVPCAFGGTVDVSAIVEDTTGNLQYGVVAAFNSVLGVAVIRLRFADNENDKTYTVRQGSDGDVLQTAGSFWTSYTYETDIYVTAKATKSEGVFTLSADEKYYVS